MHLTNKVASQSLSRIAHHKRQLQSLTQGSTSCTDFLQSTKLWVDQLVVVGKPLADDDLISYVINGLNHVDAPFVTSLSFATKDHTISFDEFQSKLLSHEIFLNQHHHLESSASTAHAMYSNKTYAQFNHRKQKGQFTPG